MKVATAAEMREIDRITIEEYGVPGQILMERAGLAIASRAKCFSTGKKIMVLCGAGNNGGDGLVTARLLHNSGYNVKALILSKPEKLSPDCSIQLNKAKSDKVPIEFREQADHSDFSDSFVIDAVFGTGLSKPVIGGIAATFKCLNETGSPVLSVDIASGVSADTGQKLGEAVRADYTVTFGLPKRGHFLYPGAELCGSLYIENIGFPDELINSENIKTSLINWEAVANLIPKRPRASHKGDYGHTLIVAGSKGKTGAALIAAKACLRSGAGLVTIGVPESLMDVFQSRVTEEMLLPLPDKGDGTMHKRALNVILDFASHKADALAIGPGIGVSPETEYIMDGVVASSSIPLIIDADGLNSLLNAHDRLKKAKAPVIITPHPGEMARLLKQKKQTTIDDIEKDRINVALSFSLDTGACVVLKGAPTIVADSNGNVGINTSGNPGMATAGSGDALTGIIASFAGQGINASSAAALGVYMHGAAGDLAAQEKGEHSLIASDIIAALPAVFKSLK